VWGGLVLPSGTDARPVDGHAPSEWAVAISFCGGDEHVNSL
jgi:hypothetical protein